MRTFVLCISLLIVLVMLRLGCSPKSSPDASRPALGINLASISYWASEIVFVDVFKQSQPWTSQVPGAPFNQGGPLAIDSHGWVTRLNGGGHYAEAIMFVDLRGHYPSGNFICLYDGDGEIDFAQAGNVIERKPGRLVVKVTPSDQPISLRLLRTEPSDPIRNIRVLLPGFENTYREQPFHPDFLKRWQGFKVVRFMDWGMTNNSKVTNWADRTTPEQATQGVEAGVALEYQVQLANALDSDPWFCIPYKANDDYVREFAKLVKENLKSDRKIIIEYGNECWHQGFEGGRYCAEMGSSLGLSKNSYEGQLRYYSKRSVEIFKLVEEVFDGSEHLVRVLSTPGDSEWAIKTVLDWDDAGTNVDAIAVAPYFGREFGKPALAETTAAMTVDQLLDACQNEIEANAKRTKDIAGFVENRGLKLLAYEGGQHLVGADEAVNDDRLTKLFIAANRDPRMKGLYLQDLRGWEEAGGGAFCVFASMTRYMKWGSWGVLEYADQDEKTAPKLQAIREFMRK